MLDLMPLIGFFACIAFDLTLILLVRRRGVGLVSKRRPSLDLVLSALVIAVPYLLLALPGDPDVWDFYRSVWYLPLASLSALTIVLSREVSRVRQTG